LDRHKNLWVGLIVIFILDRINRIDWIYCFLGFHLPAIASSSEAGGDETMIHLCLKQRLSKQRRS
jgi:hypothetical protein